MKLSGPDVGEVWKRPSLFQQRDTLWLTTHMLHVQLPLLALQPRRNGRSAYLGLPVQWLDRISFFPLSLQLREAWSKADGSMISSYAGGITSQSELESFDDRAIQVR